VLFGKLHHQPKWRQNVLLCLAAAGKATDENLNVKAGNSGNAMIAKRYWD
jgi:hypothetical protein